MPIHLQIRIENIFENAQFGIYTESIWGTNLDRTKNLILLLKNVVIIISIEKIQKVKVNREDASFVDIKVLISKDTSLQFYLHCISLQVVSPFKHASMM